MRWLSGLLLAGACLAQVAPPQGLRANRNTYHPVVELIQPDRTPLSPAEVAALEKLPFESMWGAVQSLGYRNSHMSGLLSTRPQERIVGRALTIRYLPRRPDLEEAMRTLAKEGDWPVAYNVRAGEEVKPGDVIVVDLGGGIPDGIFFGDISALGAKANGAKGAVLYGSTRDKVELEAMAGFPVLAVGFDPRPATQIGVDWNVPIRVGPAVVLPGDVVVADSEAVMFFPKKILAEVIKRSTEQAEKEDFERKMVDEKKHRFRDVYPLNPELQKRFEEERKKKQQ